ncbi:response regulator [Azoarcus communis]|uniref:DNA-binding response regulator n=1 Tax=Parazoarcus communis SWub3 = DSM 12120 TaxID=1121029 RepID=A0A323UVU9_9RHOO|nr:response regulator transcription factor [Parazoarcus communis]NMG46907.1 response regulator [Parazoarcus communis]NMG70013.1 response regulator [Parazoarcus communis SWub3 = DSM 12120]PZA16555.1 DNA-binding response regulator [Azoarcus communis] [Parazoarcus communis SWub3 = DSM 12120]
MRILLVEDEPTLNLQITRKLKSEGYIVDIAVNGIDALHLGMENDFDAVILDLGLPQLDGLSVLGRWRASRRNMPVLILTARGDWHERVAGIDAGADDYLVKPFHMEELLARLRALIRRSAGQASNELVCGALRLDIRRAEAAIDGQSLSLTSHEFKVLAYLMQRRGEVVSRSELSEHIYPHDSDRDSNTIEVFVGRLRKKLPAGMIETVRGFGYRLGQPS